jgi:hypothetical protein
MGTP